MQQLQTQNLELRQQNIAHVEEIQQMRERYEQKEESY